MSNSQEKMQLKICASFLEQHTKVNNFSLFLTLIALFLFIYFTTINKLSTTLLVTLIIVILLGIYETILAIRVGFDAAIINHLACQERVGDEELRSLDKALVDLKLIGELIREPISERIDGKQNTRDIKTRLQACMKLFKKQALSLVIQLAILITASLI